MKKTLVYLAVPYSHPDTAIRELRFYEANVAAAKLMQVGWLVFSPISHTLSPVDGVLTSHPQ